jgi:hypothetical protein
MEGPTCWSGTRVSAYPKRKASPADTMTAVALDQPNLVPSAIPSTSPILQPVRQCTVARTAN